MMVKNTITKRSLPQKRISKKQQLVKLLSKPNGIRAVVLQDKFGWQAHSLRAAISGLRKDGYSIVRANSSGTGGTLYSIADTDVAVNPSNTTKRAKPAKQTFADAS